MFCYLIDRLSSYLSDYWIICLYITQFGYLFYTYLLSIKFNTYCYNVQEGIDIQEEQDKLDEIKNLYSVKKHPEWLQDLSRFFDDDKKYQLNMALAAIGNSDIWGAGLGESMQKHLYLPEAHTDFVFAVGAEELGIVFSVSVVLLFVAFFLLSVYIARKASDRFGRFLVIGMAFIIFFQAMFNIGVVCKALPTKGMALPFFSYGVTSLWIIMANMGILLNISKQSRYAKF